MSKIIKYFLEKDNLFIKMLMILKVIEIIILKILCLFGVDDLNFKSNFVYLIEKLIIFE